MHAGIRWHYFIWTSTEDVMFSTELSHSFDSKYFVRSASFRFGWAFQHFSWTVQIHCNLRPSIQSPVKEFSMLFHINLYDVTGAQIQTVLMYLYAEYGSKHVHLLLIHTTPMQDSKGEKKTRCLESNESLLPKRWIRLNLFLNCVGKLYHNFLQYIGIPVSINSFYFSENNLTEHHQYMLSTPVSWTVLVFHLTMHQKDPLMGSLSELTNTLKV